MFQPPELPDEAGVLGLLGLFLSPLPKPVYPSLGVGVAGLAGVGAAPVAAGVPVAGPLFTENELSTFGAAGCCALGAPAAFLLPVGFCGNNCLACWFRLLLVCCDILLTALLNSLGLIDVVGLAPAVAGSSNMGCANAHELISDSEIAFSFNNLDMPQHPVMRLVASVYPMYIVFPSHLR